MWYLILSEGGTPTKVTPVGDDTLHAWFRLLEAVGSDRSPSDEFDAWAELDNGAECVSIPLDAYDNYTLLRG